MKQGRRARNGCGSLQRDRPQRWGASGPGHCQRTSRACCMWCRTPASRTDRSWPDHELGRRPIERRLGSDRNSMIKGRRARNVSGSPHGDRPKRWGASLTGVGQRTLCACWIGCRTSASVTDRSSFEPWLERSLHPGLPSDECLGHAKPIPTRTRSRAPP